PDALDTLAERLHAAGFDTAAFVSAFVLDARYRLGQGFDVYDDQTRPSSSPLDFTVPMRAGGATTDAALAWLRGRSTDRPFFLWVHYYDAHLPRHGRRLHGRSRRGPRRARRAHARGSRLRLDVA